MPELGRAPDIRAYFGTTGSGKTWQTKRDIRAHRGRVVAWDWKGYDYRELEAVTLPQLARRVRWDHRLRYCPDFSLVPPKPWKPLETIAWQFDLFCRIVWQVQLEDSATECLVIVDELHEVTSASYAPPVWRRLVAQGRVNGISIIGVTPRPALVDMTFRTNANTVRSGRLGELADAKAVGQRIGVEPRELQLLPDRAAYVFDGRKVQLEHPGKRRATRTMDATG